MSTSPRSRRIPVIAAACLAGGAILANAAFVGLGSVFDYPDVLLRPTDEILELFRGNRTAVMSWFAVLASAAALLAPGAVLLARQGTSRAARWSAWAGVEAAVVQVIGLSRWFLVVPPLARTAGDPTSSAADAAQAADRFELAHNVLGKVIGETLGYGLTAFWTVLVIVGLPHLRGGRIGAALGGMSAFLIALGMLTPLGVPGTDAANFAGYVLWTVWVLALAVRLVRNSRTSRSADRQTSDAAAVRSQAMLAR